ncbi:MAG TPA: hypothetical protein VMR49_02990 [Candidatus Paceibacterota bacterium]|nr:hypothetical protein [Candidatus Paceibacterota bacterium]
MEISFGITKSRKTVAQSFYKAVKIIALLLVIFCSFIVMAMSDIISYSLVSTGYDHHPYSATFMFYCCIIGGLGGVIVSLLSLFSLLTKKEEPEY